MMKSNTYFAIILIHCLIRPGRSMRLRSGCTCEVLAYIMGQGRHTKLPHWGFDRELELGWERNERKAANIGLLYEGTEKCSNIPTLLARAKVEA